MLLVNYRILIYIGIYEFQSMMFKCLYALNPEHVNLPFPWRK